MLVYRVKWYLLVSLSLQTKLFLKSYLARIHPPFSLVVQQTLPEGSPGAEWVCLRAGHEKDVNNSKGGASQNRNKHIYVHSILAAHQFFNQEELYPARKIKSQTALGQFCQLARHSEVCWLAHRIVNFLRLLVCLSPHSIQPFLKRCLSTLCDTQSYADKNHKMQFCC